MEDLLLFTIAFETLLLLIMWRHYRPHNVFEVRIKLTGGSVSIVEIRDWVTPLGRVHLVTETKHGPCPPPSIRHWIAAALDRGECNGEMNIDRIRCEWQVIRINGRDDTPALFQPPNG